MDVQQTETNKIYWCGFNGFGNFDNDDKKHIKFSFKLRELEIFRNNTKKISAFTISWKVTAFVYQNELYLYGFIDNKSNQKRKILTEDNIVNICNNNNIILILLCNGKVFQLKPQTLDVLEEIKLQINLPGKRNNLREILSVTLPIKHIACGFNSTERNRELLIFVTKKNAIYKNGKKIHEFYNTDIIKTVCGFQHCLILTKCGNVYAFGDGLRGQLGNLELASSDRPILIEALSGVKMIDIAAGGWHSAAISSIGDLYIWGNNCNGQLGLKLYSFNNLSSENCRKKKLPIIYPSPQLIDFPDCCENKNCDIIKVECGSRHTIVLRQCGKIFSTGWNLYGQLGIKNYSDFINNHDEFTEVKLTNCKIINIYCNQWSSIIITN